MDLPINKIHRTLLDANLPSTIEDLKNPTEEYIMNLLTTFLTRFNINVNLIEPSQEQLNIMPYHEDSELLNLINIHAVVTKIFDKIFLSDFSLTDITSPGQKRLRKQVKFISNFILYWMHKKSGFNDKMEQIQMISKQLEDLKDEKIQISEKINNTVMHKAKQMSIIEKLEADIKHIQSKTEKLNKKEMELEIIKNDMEKENQKAKEQIASIKIEAGKISKKITEVQSAVVHSPENYRSRLNEIEEQRKLKEEERDVMQEAIQDKKQSIKQINEKLDFVQKIIDEFSILADTYKKMKNKKTELKNIKEEIDSLYTTEKELETKIAMHNNQIDTEKNKLQTCREEEMVPLCNLQSQLLSEKKLLKTKLDKSQECFKEKCLKKDKLQTEIKIKEEETMAFINGCQERYNNEIAEERELRNSWKEK
ncbi:probable kinetochore protein nuf2 [Solenopsis invicta]|uniref:probable kinetochore protein nuf2 n=1 Tax=Solenopsis invicta TaxID=13686 RepID=UPI00059609B1|nr:probable kinetochore protein nuf2 [Solenopsis invicta]XP_039307403.1 probable kinetochore protein nuf2 [Solenopsis invicta]XP_039307404.1 probable kinetochore protein nuf2 [Solenopsis invicta]